MPVNPTYPGIYVEELPSSSHTIIAAPTSITVFIGYSHPFLGEYAESTTNWGTAVRIFSFADYERIFGGLFRSTELDTNLPYAVSEFFLNGGSDAYVVGIQPKYYDSATTQADDIRPATGDLGGITFTSRQVTDSTNPLEVTIRNVRSVSGSDVGDIMITCGSQRETYPSVKMLAGAIAGITDRDYVNTRLADSGLVTVTPVGGGTDYGNRFTGATLGGVLTHKLATMPGPEHFTTPYQMFNAEDFTKVFDAEKSLDKVEIFNLLSIPGVADLSVVSAALHFCESKRAFMILDPQVDTGADSSSGLPTIESTLATIPHGVPNGALYFPYLKTIDPLTSLERDRPPSGFVAGVYARTDNNRGVWKAPAGLETSLLDTPGVVDSGRMTDMRQGILNPKGLNVLRSFPGAGTVIWGARTLVTETQEQWRYIPVRRTALFIEQSLVRNLGWVVFEPNDEPLWTAIRISIENFMLSLFRQQAFQGSSPSEAFLVQCDKTTTRQVDIDAGRVNILVGFRPLKPAEFVVIRISQLAGQVQS